ncbi:MAG: hypothetical protein V1908_04265 [Candidatus Peregrinibacteria bacterium]
MINLNHPLSTHKHMSSVFLASANAENFMRRKTLSQKVEVGITSLMLVTILLVGMITLVYLVHSNRNATKGYALKNLELERSRLLMENEVWDMEIAKVKSLDTLQNDPKVQRMVKADQPLFIRGDTAIASK